MSEPTDRELLAEPGPSPSFSSLLSRGWDELVWQFEAALPLNPVRPPGEPPELTVRPTIQDDLTTVSLENLAFGNTPAGLTIGSNSWGSRSGDDRGATIGGRQPITFTSPLRFESRGLSLLFHLSLPTPKGDGGHQWYGSLLEAYEKRNALPWDVFADWCEESEQGYHLWAEIARETAASLRGGT